MRIRYNSGETGEPVEQYFMKLLKKYREISNITVEITARAHSRVKNHYSECGPHIFQLNFALIGISQYTKSEVKYT